MANIIKSKAVSAEDKLFLMGQDARFELDGEGEFAQSALLNVRKNVRARPQAPLAPKVFLSNDCIFNCAYCDCRAGNEGKRCYASGPRELAELAYRQHKESGNGIFVTSAIFKNPDYTQELIIETLKILRGQMGYTGYLHAKVMPGADPLLIEKAGRLANRLSVNIEVAKSEGYLRIAKNKNKENILTPMAQISQMVQEARNARKPGSAPFATSQTTQLMAGSTGEDDRTILELSGALYKKYRLSRVYYTPFQYSKPAAGYQDLPFVSTPLWRMARLYQADRLLCEYGFQPSDLAPEGHGFLDADIDPKLAWALRNIDRFPVEVNRADFDALLRVPGIGRTYAERIIQARRQTVVTHEVLKVIGVSLKRSVHFITCNGKYQGANLSQPDALRALLRDRIKGMEHADGEQQHIAGFCR